MRAAIVAVARSYIGTPFHHQGRCKGVGVDCAGFVACVAEELGYPPINIPPYKRSPNPHQFRAIMHEHLDSIPMSQALPGDVLAFRFVGEQHIGIIVSDDSIIHADSKFGAVIEHPLRRVWRDRRSSAWRFRLEGL